MIHAGADNLNLNDPHVSDEPTQYTGGAGGRIACCVITASTAV